MTLASGTRLGPYEVLDPIGAGGMGEVYRARDTRLGRDVAIKVLPASLSTHPESRQRFEREARAVSSLNHPNICTLHDVGVEGDTDYLVMELLEGETLAARIAKGPLPLTDVLRIGAQISDALDKAHRAGLIHRDLKPGNVMLTKGGAKLLDFGLARVTDLGGPAPGMLTHARTMSTPLTQQGSIVGTFQYMSPEQLEGKEADARSDLWALGATLYEMATGRRAFDGATQASLISSIMKDEPRAIAETAPMSPPALDRLVRACLAKDPDERIQTAHDVKLQLQWIAEGGSQAGVPAPLAARRRGRERIAWVLATIGLIGTAALALARLLAPHETARVVRFTLDTPPGVSDLGSPRISPDGRLVVSDVTDSLGRTMLWLRRIDQLESHPLAGTEGTGRAFWSPDSRWLGFFAEGRLKKVLVEGGAPQLIAEAPTGSDGSWSKDDLIVFDGAGVDPLRKVSANGGPIGAMAAADSGLLGWPEFLPDGHHLLAMHSLRTGSEICVIDAATGKRTSIGPGGSRMEYAPPGWIVYERDRTLFAQRFDARTLKRSGDPMPIAEQIGTGPNGLAHFSVSDHGQLVYSTGASQATRMAWVDRAGTLLSTIEPPGLITGPAIAPDGTHIAACWRDPTTNNRDVWIVDTVRGTRTRFTFDDAAETNPQWSPDGSQLAFSSDRRDGVLDVFVKGASGVGVETRVVADSSRTPRTTMDWSHDGRFVLAHTSGGPGNSDLLAVPVNGDHKPFPVVATPAVEVFPRLSPNGRWLAYSSDESGRSEVYVVPFPEPTGKWQISVGGGNEPQWSHDGHELFYLSSDSHITAVPIIEGVGLVPGTPKPLFSYHALPYGWSHFVPAADGRRFLVLREGNMGAAPVSPTVVLGWDAALPKH